LLWELKNPELHGHSIAKQEANERDALINEIKAAYEAFDHDKFLVPHNFHFLFSSKSLQQRLNQDHNSLQFWIWSFKEAVATQQASNSRYTEAAKKLFISRKSLDQAIKKASLRTQGHTSSETTNNQSLSILQRMTYPHGVPSLLVYQLIVCLMRVTTIFALLMCLLPSLIK
jgi:hypothetical protein